MRDSMNPAERGQLLRDIEYTKGAKQCGFVVDYYGAQCREVFALDPCAHDTYAIFSFPVHKIAHKPFPCLVHYHTQAHTDAQLHMNMQTALLFIRPSVCMNLRMVSPCAYDRDMS